MQRTLRPRASGCAARRCAHQLSPPLEPWNAPCSVHRGQGHPAARHAAVPRHAGHNAARSARARRDAALPDRSLWQPTLEVGARGARGGERAQGRRAEGGERTHCRRAQGTRAGSRQEFRGGERTNSRRA
eukprot:306207-Chlamydomonas_euryale.AAC.1